MIEPIFHHPHPADQIGTMVGLTVCLALRVALYRIGVRRNVYSGFVPLAALFMIQDCTRNDLHFWEFAAYLAWSFFGDSFPWDSWRKKLGSKLSSMTEVAKAAFQRQQSEAFS